MRQDTAVASAWIEMRRMVACCLGLIGLSACAPATVPDFTGEAPWRHWQPAATEARALVNAAPRAVIIALHGFNDYSNAFQDFADFARRDGVAVHAYDQRGFGANADRGRWAGTDRLTAHLRDAVDHLRRIYGDTPLYVLGESMGGAVTIVAATGMPSLPIDGMILVAPAVWGGPHFSPFYRAMLWLASNLAPGWELTGSGLEIWPSDNIEMLRAFSADPLVIKGARTDAIAGLVRLMDRALASADKLDGRLLLLTGEKDEIIPRDALSDFEGRLTNEQATRISYPDGYHMLLRDLQRKVVFEDILAWIDRAEESGRQTPLAAESHPKAGDDRKLQKAS